VPDRYLLAVGTLEPRKNLPGVLAAHNLLRASRPDAPPLVIAGAAGWRTGGLSDELRKLSEGGSVRWLGYVDDAELKALYTHAAGLLFCPFYEGFGLPVLEAMAAGCPVIATDRGAVREVAGDAALLVDPAAAGEIATAAARLLDEPALRARLVNGGRARAAAYPWRQTGERLREAVEQAVELKRAAGATPR
jgi:alpha-1,3-rhamnosyl/mannosyltransferase